MCLNCGCGQPNERHGIQSNIVADDIRRAGEANDQDLATTVSNLRASLGQMPGMERQGAAQGDLRQPMPGAAAASTPSER